MMGEKRLASIEMPSSLFDGRNVIQNYSVGKRISI